MWSEIRNDYLETYFEDTDGDLYAVIDIDAYITLDDDEEGRAIAKVILTKSGDVCVIYIDNTARHNSLAIEKIKESVEELKNLYAGNKTKTVNKPGKRIYEALKLAIIAHDGQYDKGGNPYILHPLHLAMQADNEDEAIVSLLHDAVEDTKFTLDDIVNYGFLDVIDAIDNITKRPGEEYKEYLKRVESDETSLKVKIRDMKHNLNKSRLPKDKQHIFDSLNKKYAKYLPLLEQTLIVNFNNKN